MLLAWRGESETLGEGGANGGGQGALAFLPLKGGKKKGEKGGGMEGGSKNGHGIDVVSGVDAVNNGPGNTPMGLSGVTGGGKVGSGPGQGQGQGGHKSSMLRGQGIIMEMAKNDADEARVNRLVQVTLNTFINCSCHSSQYILYTLK